MAMSMSQVNQINKLQGGLGSSHNVASIIGSIIGPVAGAGSDIFRTATDSKQNKRELKQRRREFNALIPVYKSQQQQQALETIAAVRQQQVVSGYQATYAPYVVAAIALFGISLAFIAVGKS